MSEKWAADHCSAVDVPTSYRIVLNAKYDFLSISKLLDLLNNAESNNPNVETPIGALFSARRPQIVLSSKPDTTSFSSFVTEPHLIGRRSLMSGFIIFFTAVRAKAMYHLV